LNFKKPQWRGETTAVCLRFVRHRDEFIKREFGGAAVNRSGAGSRNFVASAYSLSFDRAEILLELGRRAMGIL
jgi:hypothetical protein